MKYDNSEIRRQDRLLAEDRAMELIKESEYGFLAMADEGAGYGVPVNYAFDGGNSLYIHCAGEGKKLVCLAKSPCVTFCIVGKSQIAAEKFTAYFESVILSGSAVIVTSPEEKRRAIELILEKYSPNDLEKGRVAAASAMSIVGIIRIDVDKFSGKCKKPKKPANQ